MGLLDFIAGRVMRRRLKVYKIDDFSVEPPETRKAVERPKAQRVMPSVKISTVKPYDFAQFKANMTVKAVKAALGNKAVTASRYRIKRYVKEDVKTQRLDFAKKPPVKSFVKQIQALPQERDNILKQLKNKPESLRNEVILACYGPIVEGAVLKLVLNKQRGTLLIWYKAESRRLKAKNVYLVRKLGLGGQLEWRWE